MPVKDRGFLGHFDHLRRATVLKWGNLDYRTHRLALFAAASTAAFCLYVVTAAHDIEAGAGIDAAKFGYMGRILGVPHAPGYPLYLLVSWAFSWVPIGPLIFRMNVLSAVFGAATVCLVGIFATLVECSPEVSSSVAFLAGTGPLFWSQAIIAEVYTLHTTLLVATLVALIAWRRLRSRRWLYMAALSFGLGLAHHTDIAVYAPAIFVFVLATDRRLLVSGRTLARVSALVAAPLALYAYVVIRTRSGAEYVEAAATSVGQLVSVVAGRQFGYLLFRSSLADAVRLHAPIVAHFVSQELGVAGCILAAAGIAALWRRDRHVCLLIVIGSLGMLAFVVNYFAPDIEVFLLPLVILLWVPVAVGAEGVRRLSPRLTAPGIVFLLAWSVWHGASGFAANSPHVERAGAPEGRMLRQFFEQLPDGAAIVGDTVDLSQMLLYKIIGERVADSKHPKLVVPDIFGGPRVFAYVRSTPQHPVIVADAAGLDRIVREHAEVFVFALGAQYLRAVGFRLDPVRLPDRPLGEFLSHLPPGLIVVMAVPASIVQSATAHHAMFSPVVGQAVFDSGHCYGTIGVVDPRDSSDRFAWGRRRARHPSSRQSISAADQVEIRKGEPIGPRGRRAPADISATCDRERATIVVNGRTVSKADSAIAIATIDPDGRVGMETAVAPELGFEVPFDWREEPLYRIAEPRTCVSVSESWGDITEAASQAALAINLPPTAGMRVYVASDSRLQPRYAQANFSDIPFHASEVGEHEVRAASGATVDRPRTHHGLVRWMRLDIGPKPDARADAIDLILGAPARVAIASVDRASVDVSVCSLTLGQYAVLAGPGGFERVTVDEARDELFGDGWHEPEHDAAGGFRWTSARDAHLLVPFGDGTATPIRVSVDSLVPENAHGAGGIGLSVNGERLPGREAKRGWQSYEWIVPASLWRRGLNDLMIHASVVAAPAGNPADTRVLGVAVREVDFKRLTPAG